MTENLRFARAELPPPVVVLPVVFVLPPQAARTNNRSNAGKNLKSLCMLPSSGRNALFVERLSDQDVLRIPCAWGNNLWLSPSFLFQKWMWPLSTCIMKLRSFPHSSPNLFIARL